MRERDGGSFFSLHLSLSVCVCVSSRCRVPRVFFSFYEALLTYLSFFLSFSYNNTEIKKS